MIPNQRSQAMASVYICCAAFCAMVVTAALAAYLATVGARGAAAGRLEPQFDQAAMPVLPAKTSVSLPISLPQITPRVISTAPEPQAVLAPQDAGGQRSGEADMDEWTSYTAWTPQKGTYRTVCVRLCDGAQFPVSFSTTRDRFKADAAKCQSNCSSPTRLFVGPPTGPLSQMVDVNGNAYSDLATAFKFTTSYDAACTCRGQPWETASLERHRALARDAKTVAQAIPPVVLQPVAVVKEKAPLPSSAAGVSVAETRLVTSRGALPVVAVKPVGKVAAVKPKRVKAVIVAAAKPHLRGSAYAQARETGQRAFTSERYWRLSYWDAPN